MTIQLDRPTSRSGNDVLATAGICDPEPVFVGGWSAALHYYNQREFDDVLDNIAHDPASQRELQASWILGH